MAWKAMLEALLVPTEGDWRQPHLEPLPELSRGARLLFDVRWARGYLAPWVARRLRGHSSGDSITAKRPDASFEDSRRESSKMRRT